MYHQAQLYRQKYLGHIALAFYFTLSIKYYLLLVYYLIDKLVSSIGNQGRIMVGFPGKFLNNNNYFVLSCRKIIHIIELIIKANLLEY